MTPSSRDPRYIPPFLLWGATLSLIAGVGCLLAFLLNPAERERQPLVVVGMFGLIGLSLVVRGATTLIENELRRRRGLGPKTYLGISKSGYYETESYVTAQIGSGIPLVMGIVLAGIGLRALGF